MQCTVTSSIVFIILSLIYGSSFAGNTQGLKYFSPALYIAFRMLFGFALCVVILIARILIHPKEYTQIVKAHFRSGIGPIIWMAVAGLLFHGVPHCMIAISQQWVNSASVQLAQPLATCAGAISAHFVIPEEHFTWTKFWSLILAVLGVAIPAIPQFRRSDASGNIGNLAIGYVLLIVGTCFFGFAGTVMKKKTPNADITVASTVQTLASSIVCFIVSLIWDKPGKIQDECLNAPSIAWLWPFIVGALGTGVAGNCYTYLVKSIGATGASFITVGQVAIGVILGVAALNEWSGYAWWEIFLSILGLVCLIFSIVVEFALSGRKPQQVYESSSGEKSKETTSKSNDNNQSSTETTQTPKEEDNSNQWQEGVDDKTVDRIEEL